MTNRERFHSALNFKPVDRLPVIEFAPWWNKTIAAWQNEGLPHNLSCRHSSAVGRPEVLNIPSADELCRHFDLDEHTFCRISPFRKVPGGKQDIIRERPDTWTMDDYQKIKRHLFPDMPFHQEQIRQWAQQQKNGELVVLLALDGFFWFPRDIFGIETHLCAFYDYPEIMHAMNADFLKYNLRALGQFCEICIPDLVMFSEDMSYNRGPMVSATLFEDFVAPYYRRLIPRVKEYGIIPFVDTDGNIDELIPWFIGIGIDGFAPLERQAGTDLAKLRKRHPQIKLIGGYDKMVMTGSEENMRQEFERILPVMKQGGYIPSVDHQTPPGVSLANYHIYLKLLREYCMVGNGS